MMSATSSSQRGAKSDSKASAVDASQNLPPVAWRDEDVNFDPAIHRLTLSPSDCDCPESCQPHIENQKPRCLLAEWLQNAALTKIKIDPFCHYDRTLESWINGQRTPEEFVHHFKTTKKVDEVHREILLKSASYYRLFRYFLDRALDLRQPKRPRHHLHAASIREAISVLEIGICKIQYLNPAYLKHYPDYIDALLNATIYCLGVIGCREWADQMEDSRVRNDPVRTFLNWYQPPLVRSTVRTFPEYFEQFEKEISRKVGTFEDNRTYYKPTMIVDSHGHTITNLSNEIYITEPDETEALREVAYRQRREYYSNRPAKQKLSPHRQKSDYHRLAVDNLYYECVREYRRSNKGLKGTRRVFLLDLVKEPEMMGSPPTMGMDWATTELDSSQIPEINLSSSATGSCYPTPRNSPNSAPAPATKEVPTNAETQTPFLSVPSLETYAHFDDQLLASLGLPHSFSGDMDCSN